MKPIKLANAHTDAWKAARSLSIGSSEAAAAVGISPYSTPLEVYARKRGEIPEFEGNDYTRMGQLLEPIVKSEFCRVTETILRDPNPGLYQHPVHVGITATPDGIISDDELLEAKTASWRMKGSWGGQGSDDVPDQYLVQCQWQMAVMGASLVHLPVLFDGAELKLFKVMRNEDLISLLIKAGLELLERIRDGRPPEPTWTHPSTPQLIKEIHSSIEDTRINLTDAEVVLWNEYEALGRIIKGNEERRDECKSRVLHAIGDNFAGLLPDGRMIRRKVVAASTYTATRKEFIDVRVVKQDDGTVIDRLEYDKYRNLTGSK